MMDAIFSVCSTIQNKKDIFKFIEEKSPESTKLVHTMRTAHAIFRILVAKHRFSLLSFKRGSTDSTNSHFPIKAGHLRAKSRNCSIPHEVVEKKTRTTAIFKIG